MAQTPWSIVLPDSIGRTAVSDAVELADGRVVASAFINHMLADDVELSRTWVVGAGPQGELEWIKSIELGTDTSVVVTSLLLHGEGTGVFATGMAWDWSTSSGFSAAYVELDQTGTIQQAFKHPVTDGVNKFYFHSTVVGSDGSLWSAGWLWMDGALSMDRLLLIKADDMEGTFQSAIFGISNGLRAGFHIVPNGALMQVSMIGGAGFGPSGHTKIVRHDQDLVYMDGVTVPSLSVAAEPNQLDSVLKDDLYMTGLADGTTIISGRFGNVFPMGMRAALVRFDNVDSYVGMFLPRGDYVHDYVGGMQGHDRTANGQIVFAMVENYFAEPFGVELGTAPSRIHIYRLDTLLNVECEHIVDGFEDNAYYYLTRIKAASDGGVLLMGSRRDLNTMDQPRGWLMKLGPEQCTPVGVEEAALRHGTEVFPNPGRDGFTLLLNGPAMHGARLHLFDAMGAQVRSEPMNANTIQVNALDLAPGLYVYRVTGRDGRVLGSGRWVRE